METENLIMKCKNMKCGHHRRDMNASVHVCVCVVYAPHISVQSVGGSLQRPCEEGELSSEVFLVEAFGVRGQKVQVLSERAQSVVATAVDHMTERRLHRRHVLRQEVVFHLQDRRRKRF